jgi:hypothetical protein
MPSRKTLVPIAGVDFRQTSMLKQIIYALYLGFVGLTVLLGLWCIWTDLNEIIHVAQGEPTEWAQMTYMTSREITLYSFVYLILNLTFTTLTLYFFYKKKRKPTITFAALIWTIMLIGLYTDVMTSIGL